MTTLDRIYIADRGNRARFRWVVGWTAHTVNPDNGQALPAYDKGEPAGFNSRGDAELYALELERRLFENLGHQTERVDVP